MDMGRLSSVEVGSWVITLVLVIVSAIAVGHHLRLSLGRTIVMCSLLLVVPIGDFLFSWHTFAGSGAYPTAQLSLHEQNLWSRWASFWPLLLLVSLVNLALPPVMLCIWCNRAKHWYWSAALLCGMAEVAGLISIHAVFANFPSA